MQLSIITEGHTLANRRSISRLLSLMLRHRPDEFGLNIDAYGHVPLKDVIQAVMERYDDVTEDDIVTLVNDPEQHRFEITGNGIRALYGHSFYVEMDGEPMQPPETLYMGSTAAAAQRMKTQGIVPGDRFYVHLSLTREAAAERSREVRGPVVVEVRAKEAAEAGVAFYARGSVVLTPEVPAAYVGAIQGADTTGSPAAASRIQAPEGGHTYGRKLRKSTRR